MVFLAQEICHRLPTEVIHHCYLLLLLLALSQFRRHSDWLHLCLVLRPTRPTNLWLCVEVRALVHCRSGKVLTRQSGLSAEFEAFQLCRQVRQIQELLLLLLPLLSHLDFPLFLQLANLMDHFGGFEAKNLSGHLQIQKDSIADQMLLVFQSWKDWQSFDHQEFGEKNFQPRNLVYLQLLKVSYEDWILAPPILPLR